MSTDPTDIPDEQVTRLRIVKEQGEWFLDGTDGRGNYSTACWSYDTFASAWADVTDFATTFPELGRHGISNDMSADYCRLARWRTSDPKQQAKAARRKFKPPAEQVPGVGEADQDRYDVRMEKLHDRAQQFEERG